MNMRSYSLNYPEGKQEHRANEFENQINGETHDSKGKEDQPDQRKEYEHDER